MQFLFWRDLTNLVQALKKQYTLWKISISLTQYFKMNISQQLGHSDLSSDSATSQISNV
jgi:hypothetical protein